MNSLRTIFRCMLLVWLVLVAALGFAVSRGTHTTYAGNTMAFLFSSAGREKVELPPVERRAVPPVAEEPHAEPPAPEWSVSMALQESYSPSFHCFLTARGPS